jgi:hypothetical protein
MKKLLSRFDELTDKLEVHWIPDLSLVTGLHLTHGKSVFPEKTYWHQIKTNKR